MMNQCVMTEGGTRAAERADRGSVTCSNLIRQQVLELFLIDWVLHIAAGRRPALRYVLSSVFQRIPAYSNVFRTVDAERPAYSSVFQHIPAYSSLFPDLKIFLARNSR
jgi:hypothetical protein